MNLPPLALYTGRLLFHLAVRIDNRTPVLYLRRDVTHYPAHHHDDAARHYERTGSEYCPDTTEWIEGKFTNLLWDVTDLINVLI